MDVSQLTITVPVRSLRAGATGEVGCSRSDGFLIVTWFPLIRQTYAHDYPQSSLRTPMTRPLIGRAYPSRIRAQKVFPSTPLEDR
ncbi:hypothetical protein GCM10012278_16630 [Nonomuraea glycinis]|uniref:Uncharacterized protein n=1 Tax=Nonomuraea glycinis TaxID=2047744 RepID=A0A918A232_9ACTN|nr:hypothetical protein GCM10012278_16630 [Nonomuraea glycinis]